jgi:flagellar motor switch protein FliG
MARPMTYESLSGLNKSAAIILSISNKSRSAILGALPDREVRELSLAMSNLGPMDPHLVDFILEEFIEGILGGKGIMGDFEQTRKMLEETLGRDRTQMILEGVESDQSEIWDKLSQVKQDSFASFLSHEKPQTIAVILSRINAAQSAGILKILPEKLAEDVVMRMLKTTSIKKETLNEIQNSLKIEFVEDVGHRGKRQDPHKVLAEIFNAFDNQTESFFMDFLGKENPESADRVRALMFTIDDLKRIDRSDMQKVLREIDKSSLALALKGLSDPLKEIFFSNMSERAAKFLKEDMLALGSVRLRDVEIAQKGILSVVKQMEYDGEITISERSGDNDFIV